MRLNLAPFDPIRFECEAEVLCARCHDMLDRHQPSDDQPDRLLGTCTTCGAWFQIDMRDCRMFLLPDLGDGTDSSAGL